MSKRNHPIYPKKPATLIFKTLCIFSSSFFPVPWLNNTCFASENTLTLGDATLSEWEIYFFNKNKNQLGANPIFKKGFELFDIDEIPQEQTIALDIGCGVGFEAAWILQKGWNRVDCIDALPIVKNYLMKNIPEDAEKQGRLTFTPVKFEDFEITTHYRLVCAYLSLFFYEKSEQFDAAMKKALNAVASGGRFIGAFFGPKHSWNGHKKIIFLTEEELKSYFHNFTIEIFEHTESDYDSGNGMAHYDVFHITAKKQ
jgi:SAM-dependent methyltransferase